MLAAFQKLNRFFARHDRLALVCHRQPDGDALGSLLALGHFLAAQDKTVGLYCFDRLPFYLRFLADTSQIKNALDDFWRTAPAAVLLDCGDLGMTGLTSDDFAGKRLAVIDHHASNLGYGEINCLDSRASATAEIIYQFFINQRWAIDKTTATALLLGIYTDTDAFSNLATTPEALAAAAELLKLGARLREIVAQCRQNKTIASLKLWGRALARLRWDQAQAMAVTAIREQDLIECQARFEDSEGLASLLNHLADAKMALVLREQGNGTVKGSLRTTHELIDVAKIAKLWGGGGHTKAAGFTVKGRLVEAKEGWRIIK